MGTTRRLAAFTALLAVVLAASFAVGRAVDPIRTSGDHHHTGDEMHLTTTSGDAP